MPQYYIRGAVSQTMASVRTVRQMAVGSRRPWKITFMYGDPPEGGNYYYSRLTSNNADMSDPDNWERMARDMRPLAGRPLGNSLVNVPTVTLEVDGGLNDVDCDEHVDLIFLRDGTVSDQVSCEGDELVYPPNIRYTIDNRWIRWNTYTLNFDRSGSVEVVRTKE